MLMCFPMASDTRKIVVMKMDGRGANGGEERYNPLSIKY